jgi:hypothetical protein
MLRVGGAVVTEDGEPVLKKVASDGAYERSPRRIKRFNVISTTPITSYGRCEDGEEVPRA